MTEVACHLFSRLSEFTEAKTLQPNSSDLSLFNYLLWRDLQQKLYCQEIRNVDIRSRGVHPPNSHDATLPPSLPLFFLYPFLPSLPFPYSPFPSSLPCHSFPSFLPLEVGPLNPARGLGKRCKLPQCGLDLKRILLHSWFR